jgi:hypothetical protein
MFIPRADRKAEAAIKRGAGIEVAHGMDDMVKTAGHSEPI